MIIAMADQNEEMEKILRRLQFLEQRLSRLESAVNINTSELVEVRVLIEEPVLTDDVRNDEEKEIETQIGRYGLAWLGNIVLLFGIVFLTQYMMNLGYRISSLLLGYIASGSMIFLAGYIKKTNFHLASIFRINALLLLFYITIRLHFFSITPLISQKGVSLFLLSLLVVLQIYLSIRNKSQIYAALAVLFAMATSILSDSTNLTPSVVIIMSAITIYLNKKYSWEPLVIVTIFLSYFVFVLWLFG